DVLAARLKALGAEVGGTDLVELVDAPEVIEMGEDAARAVRAKPRSSIRVAAELCRDGAAGALVSAGSTGATLAASLLALGRMEGIRRPAVAVVIPLAAPSGSPEVSLGRQVILVDAGGTPDATADMLPTYASMGSAYARALGVARPRIGLLNVGEEPGKGSALAKEAFVLLEQAPGFAGNVEPAAVFAGAVDVVVTDGFTGNVFLKTIEAFRAAGEDQPGAGAALLLGVRGHVLVAHGAAGENEILAALRTAATLTAADLVGTLTAALAVHEGGET
ncbi:MAG: phosphate--acyl-ACP acyltransferase, partial [Candidatus Rokuibacteriota bacterium]